MDRFRFPACLTFRKGSSVRLKEVGYSNSFTSVASPRVAKEAAGSIAYLPYATEVSQAAQYSPSLKTSGGEKDVPIEKSKYPIKKAFFLCQMGIFLLRSW